MIFIVGVGRSGTTLLQAILNSHSQISFPPETHFIKNYLSKKNTNFTNSKDLILKDRYLKNLDINLGDILKNTSSLKEFYKKLLKKYCLKKGKTFIGDKDPKNIEHLKLIYRCFNDPYIIHIYRDPRAVIHSRINTEWSKNRPLWTHILAYKAQFTYMMKYKYIFRDKYIEVKYEQLIKSPKNELQKILNKLNLKYEDAMLEFSKNAEEIVQGEEFKWKNNVYKPILNTNDSMWKKKLDTKTICKIEKSLSNELEVGSYTFNYKSRIYSNFFKLLSKLYQIKYCD